MIIAIRDGEVYTFSPETGDYSNKVDTSESYRVSPECSIAAEQMGEIKNIFSTICREYAKGGAITPEDQGVIAARIVAQFYSIRILIHMKAICLDHDDSGTSFITTIVVSPISHYIKMNTPNACYIIQNSSMMYVLDHNNGELGKSLQLRGLSRYEKSILLLSMYGLKNREIAVRLSKSEIAIKKKKKAS